MLAASRAELMNIVEAAEVSSGAVVDADASVAHAVVLSIPPQPSNLKPRSSLRSKVESSPTRGLAACSVASV